MFTPCWDGHISSRIRRRMWNQLWLWPDSVAYIPSAVGRFIRRWCRQVHWAQCTGSKWVKLWTNLGSTRYEQFNDELFQPEATLQMLGWVHHAGYEHSRNPGGILESPKWMQVHVEIIQTNKRWTTNTKRLKNWQFNWQKLLIVKSLKNQWFTGVNH